MDNHPIRFNLQSSWEEVAEKIKETNIHITDEDLEYIPGKEDELLNRLEKKMSLDKENIIYLIESISGNQGIAS
jgi:hypothetical protein